MYLLQKPHGPSIHGYYSVGMCFQLILETKKENKKDFLCYCMTFVVALNTELKPFFTARKVIEGQYGQMKSRAGQRQREEESRREKIREEKESEESRCRCAKR